MTIMTKPKMMTNGTIGRMISLVEDAGFHLVNTLSPKSFTYNEIRDMYDLAGRPFNTHERSTWEFENGSMYEETGIVFTFTFEAEDGHELIRFIDLVESYPVIYIKVA